MCRRITDKIFPESELPLIWEPIAAAEGMFELLALRNDSDHYYRTLRIWDDNLAACHDQAVALVGEPTVKDFRLVFAHLGLGLQARPHLPVAHELQEAVRVTLLTVNRTAPSGMPSPLRPRACRDPRGQRRECVGSV